MLALFLREAQINRKARIQNSEVMRVFNNFFIQDKMSRFGKCVRNLPNRHG